MGCALYLSVGQGLAFKARREQPALGEVFPLELDESLWEGGAAPGPSHPSVSSSKPSEADVFSWLAQPGAGMGLLLVTGPKGILFSEHSGVFQSSGMTWASVNGSREEFSALTYGF